MKANICPMKTYPFEHFYNQMPKEIQELITPESRTAANEFETMAQAVLAGIAWKRIDNWIKISDYYDSLKTP